MGKQCRKCSVDLIVGDNWSASQQKNYNYNCKSCHSNEFHNSPTFKDIQKKYSSSSKALKRKNIRQTSIPAGIYGIFYDCKLVYIGESAKPYTRKTQHLSKLGFKGGTKEECATVVCQQKLNRDNLRFKMLEFIDDTVTRKQREAALIQRYSPIYNSDMYSHIQ